MNLYDNGFLPVGSSGDLWSANPEFCLEWGPGQCSGGTQVGWGSATYNWTIGATSIIKATSSSQLTSGSPSVIGVSGGLGSGYVNVEGGGCQSGGSDPGTVQVPTSLKLVKAPPTILQQGTGLRAGCPPGWYGIGIDVDYQVLDQNTKPIASANMEPQELLTGKTTYTDIGGPQPNYPQSAKFTRVDGTFDDVPVEKCPPVPVTTLTPFETQSIQILLNGIPYPVRINNWSYKTTNLPNQGTLTNGKDINATQ